MNSWGVFIKATPKFYEKFIKFPIATGIIPQFPLRLSKFSIRRRFDTTGLAVLSWASDTSNGGFVQCSFWHHFTKMMDLPINLPEVQW
jgi:hypothetical protein